MNEKYEPGRCHLCKKDTMIRHKNIYWIGSEGLWVCHDCEMKIVRFVEGLARDSFKDRIRDKGGKNDRR